MIYNYQTLHVKTDPDGVTEICLNRPTKKNAMSAEMIAELTHLSARLNADDKTRVAVLSGAGDVFCAGGDLAWMKEQFAADRAGRILEARKLAEMLYALNTLNKPLIGKIHGGAFGGGVGLLCVCDFVIAEKDTQFGLTETRLGLIPATISPYVIARMGEGAARRVFMSGRIFDSEEAKTLGLVAQTVAEAELNNAVERQIVPYLHAAPEAVSAAKALARSLGPRIDDAVIDDTISRLADTWETSSAAEGINAFFDRRKANWVRKRTPKSSPH